MSLKLSLMLVAWAIALITSLGLRQWGIIHSEPFLIRPLIIWLLIFGPSVFLGLWLVLLGFRSQKN